MEDSLQVLSTFSNINLSGCPFKLTQVINSMNLEKFVVNPIVSGYIYCTMVHKILGYFMSRE